MAPRMHIETADAPEPEVEAPSPQVTPSPSVTAAAPKSKAPKAQVQAPKAKVDAQAESFDGTVEPASVTAPAISAPTAATAPKSAASAPKPTAGDSKADAAPKSAVRPQVKVAPATEIDRMADVEGTFEFAGEAVGRRAAAAAPKREAASTEASDESAASKGRPNLMVWVRRTFPGHVHAFWGAVVAIVVALLTFVIGLPRMLLVAILVLIGIALGQVLDGDPKIIRTIRDLFSSDRER